MNNMTIVIIIFVWIIVTLNLVGLIKRFRTALKYHKTAIQCIGEEVSIYKDKGAKYAYKGVRAYLIEDYSKALKCFEIALKHSDVSHNCSFCYDWMSQCYEAQNKPIETLAYSVKAANAEPSNIKSAFNLAENYARIGLFEKSEFYYKRVLDSEGENVAAHFMLGMLCMSRGMYDEAKDYFLKTIEIDANFAAAYAELTILMAIKGDYSQSNSYFNKAQDKELIETERLKKRLDLIQKMQKLCQNAEISNNSGDKAYDC
ncbi:MAG: tetratricopeptide repeat protein [Oscillospiraceae bacterium]|nr:tetratricopeptide repeat protein [Oscillospiraceae bacterium]